MTSGTVDESLTTITGSGAATGAGCEGSRTYRFVKR
jgi:hypothetical protein